MTKKQNLPESIPANVYKKRWGILAILCTSLLVVMLANSSLNLALPSLASELKLDSLQLTWVVDIYSLVFASLLFTTGTLGDRYGRKLIMQTGLFIFLLGTAYAGFFATDGTSLIIARAIMGIGGAMVMPTTLSIVDNIFPRSERPKAIAVWSGIAGGGVALGSILSGFLMEHYSWQATFVFSAAVGVVGFILSQVITPESKDEKQSPVDWLGAVLSTVGLLGIVYAIIEAPSVGLLEEKVLAVLICGIVSLTAFIVWQTKTKSPMLDIKLFKIPAFGVSSLVVTLVFFSLMGIFFSISQLFQLVMGYGAMESSIKMLPIFALMILASPIVPSIVKKIGSRWTVTSGLILICIAFLTMSQWPTQPTYWNIMGSMLVMMLGMALAMTPATNMLMSAVPKNRAGMGSAMNDTTRELGGALGVAVLGSVLSSAYSDKILSATTNLPDQLKATASDSLAVALQIASNMGSVAEGLAMAAKTAWMQGLSSATIVAAIIIACAAIITALFLPHSHKKGDEDDMISSEE